MNESNEKMATLVVFGDVNSFEFWFICWILLGTECGGGWKEENENMGKKVLIESVTVWRKCRNKEISEEERKRN